MQPHHPPPPQIPGRLVDDKEKLIQLKRHVAGLCNVDNLRSVSILVDYRQPNNSEAGLLEVNRGIIDRHSRASSYWVCEKSDGIRVLVLIVSFPSNDQEVYLIDRKNEYRQQDGLFFPHPMDPRRALGNTLLDAELVTDYDPETKQVRLCAIPYTLRKTLITGITQETLNLLAFDCIVGDAQNLMSKSLTSRYGSIPNLKHGNDGLIFTCAESGYVIGTDHRILKWKPPSENSIDFKLELRFPPLPGRPSEPDFTAKPVFQLLVWTGNNSYEHFDTMQVDDAQWERHSWKASGEQYDDRVVEVTWDKTAKNWVYHRFRDDKDHGNHQSVVDKILESIRDGVEAEQVSAILGLYGSKANRVCSWLATQIPYEPTGKSAKNPQSLGRTILHLVVIHLQVNTAAHLRLWLDLEYDAVSGISSGIIRYCKKLFSCPQNNAVKQSMTLSRHFALINNLKLSAKIPHGSKCTKALPPVHIPHIFVSDLSSNLMSTNSAHLLYPVASRQRTNYMRFNRRRSPHHITQRTTQVSKNSLTLTKHKRVQPKAARHPGRSSMATDHRHTAPRNRFPAATV
ncbi:CEG1 protein [Rhizoctonia solani AG-1 IA]|uniref:mRNA guanylyltransferase n=1 Tax=Thanatephorus cucumeris (strain AG1-IA) TaxID=983506 RepID=L8X482_THACA|nr:CEG1 protein [Rhizoctonia solani AG-1 IA]